MMYAGIGNYTPSTKMIFVFAVRFRILQGSRYSSQLNHSFARPIDSNFKTTMRFGLQSPSKVSTRSLTAMYLPPYFSTIGTTRFLYSSKPTGSIISISTMTYAAMGKNFRQDLQNNQNCFRLDKKHFVDSV